MTALTAEQQRKVDELAERVADAGDHRRAAELAEVALLDDLLARHGRLFFTHDPAIALGTVAKDGKGRFHTVDDQATIVELAA